MSKSVSQGGRMSQEGGGRFDSASLYAPGGGRKYLNAAECRRVLDAIEHLAPDRALFALTLAWSGARVSEILALDAASFQIEAGVVALHTLKRRRSSVREVPIPPAHMAALEAHFGLSRRQQDSALAGERLWPWCRVTAWRIIKRVMERSHIAGRHACPRGLRHAFGIATLQSGIPTPLAQRWLGHARLSTTAIYAEACGPEERAFAARFWQSYGQPLASHAAIHAGHAPRLPSDAEAHAG